MQKLVMDILEFHPDNTEELRLAITGTKFVFTEFIVALRTVDKGKVRFQILSLICLANHAHRLKVSQKLVPRS